MPDVDSITHVRSEEPTHHPTHCCPRCAIDLAGRLRKAIFCPQCGLALAGSSQGQTVTARLGSKPPPIPLGLCDVVDVVTAWEACEDARSRMDNSAGGRSDIVAGYAKALYRLGWEYERRWGHSRNLGEAIRCYKKAARHGDAEAIARLAPQCAAISRPSFSAATDASHS